MDDRNFLKNSQIIVLGLCIAFATIFSSWLISRSMVQIKRFGSEVIGVTGSAERIIQSDQAVWTGEFTRRSPDMTLAYQTLKSDLDLVRNFLISKGLRQEDIVVNAVTTEILYRKNEKGNDTNDIEAYRLSQSVTVQSNDVGKVMLVSREATELINQGVELISTAPQFFYTKLGDLKLALLAEASGNAKQRAEQMASRTGNKIGGMRSARTGVFQITPSNSVEVSDWGVNDTSSVEKKVTAVVHLSFAITG